MNFIERKKCTLLALACSLVLAMASQANADDQVLFDLADRIDFYNPTTDPEYLQAIELATPATLMAKNEYGVSAWGIYAMNFPQIIPAFLQKGLDPNVKDQNGRSLTLAVVLSGNVEVAATLTSVLRYTSEDAALLAEEIASNKVTILKGMKDFRQQEDPSLIPEFCEEISALSLIDLSFDVMMAQFSCKDIITYPKVAQVFLDAQ